MRPLPFLSSSRNDQVTNGRSCCALILSNRWLKGHWWAFPEVDFFFLSCFVVSIWFLGLSTFEQQIICTPFGSVLCMKRRAWQREEVFYFCALHGFHFVLAVKLTLWLFNIAMENEPFIDYFPIKTTSYRGFSVDMLNNQMVTKSTGDISKKFIKIMALGQVAPKLKVSWFAKMGKTGWPSRKPKLWLVGLVKPHGELRKVVLVKISRFLETLQSPSCLKFSRTGHVCKECDLIEFTSPLCAASPIFAGSRWWFRLGQRCPSVWCIDKRCVAGSDVGPTSVSGSMAARAIEFTRPWILYKWNHRNDHNIRLKIRKDMYENNMRWGWLWSPHGWSRRMVYCLVCHTMFEFCRNVEKGARNHKCAMN